jgi:hypothetical protein
VKASDFLRLGIPLDEATRRATDFASQFILNGGVKIKLEAELKNHPKFCRASKSVFTEFGLRFSSLNLRFRGVNSTLWNIMFRKFHIL